MPAHLRLALALAAAALALPAPAPAGILPFGPRKGSPFTDDSAAAQRVELAPPNENLFKIVTFYKFMVQCKSVTV